jgi:fatty acid desaturase
VNQRRDEWQQFRFWNRVGIGAVVTVVPLLFVFAFIGNQFPAFVPVFIAVFVAWFIAYFVAYFQLRSFKCPRCGQPYLVRSAFGANSLGRKCVHCSLRLYTDA